MKRLALGLAVSWAAVVGSAFGPAARAAVKPKSPARSKEIYLEKCSPCHGKQGQSVPLFDNLKIPSFRDAEWQKLRSDDEIRERITRGKPGTPMRSFAEELNASEIEGLVRHLRTLAPGQP